MLATHKQPSVLVAPPGQAIGAAAAAAKSPRNLLIQVWDDLLRIEKQFVCKCFVDKGIPGDLLDQDLVVIRYFTEPLEQLREWRRKGATWVVKPASQADQEKQPLQNVVQQRSIGGRGSIWRDVDGRGRAPLW